MLRYLTIAKFAIESGYSEDAIRTKIRDGVWPQDQVWIKAPDGRNLIDVKGYEKWVEMDGVLKVHRKAVSKSPSSIGASAAAKGSRSSPPPLI